MDTQFWHKKWREKELGFHEPEANPLLTRNLDGIGVKAEARIFVPLCGKTRDIAWLLAAGFRVAGIELVRTAVDQLFDELDLTPTITEMGGLLCYRGPNLDIFVGDIFSLTPDMLGAVDMIYDRAALVALPPQMREDYARHLRHLSASAPQLLITLTYDQSLMDGPPFSVTAQEVERHYGDDYSIT